MPTSLPGTPPEAAPSGALSPALFGWDETPGVVAVEVEGREAALVRRVAPGEPLPAGCTPLGPRGDRCLERREFAPWLLASRTLEPASAEGRALAARWQELQGHELAWLLEFPDWAAFQAARERLRERGVPHLAYGSPAKQFLVRAGLTQCKGMEFGELRRMQVDLETTSLHPTEPGSRILLIAACDSEGQEWLLEGDDEAALLRQFVELVRSADPDTLEGHHLFGFDIPYLLARAGALGVPLQLGRDGSVLRAGRERRLPVGGTTRPFRPAHVWGRTLADTLFAVQRYDVGRGELPGYGLKEVARHLGIAPPDREYLDREALAATWQRDPARVRRYALQDVRETRALGELTLPTEFYQAQMVPDTYQSVATGGTGEKINSLLVREYLRRGHGIPVPRPAQAAPGGYTELRATGVLTHVVKADVESLYPSIMLRYGIQPATDTLGVFLPLLGELTERRMGAKARARLLARGGEAQAAYWDGLQASFKILINSFYGYLGAVFHFNDPQAAARVTTTGQELVRAVAAELERTGSRVIEVDTDGVYFQPPAGVRSEAEEEEYVQAVGQVLPAGIRLAHDGRYAAMLSLKVKNYALLGYDGRLQCRGASLRSRADEPFGREFLAAAIGALLRGEPAEPPRLYRELQDRLRGGLVSIEELARRERVTEKTFASAAKRKSREVARDVPVGELLQIYQRADGTLGLAQEYAGDEDRWHYLEKLYRFAERLEPAYGAEFAHLFPAPSRQELAAVRSGQLSLF